MNITIAIDSFKGSLTTVQAAEAIKRGIKLAMAAANLSACTRQVFNLIKIFNK